MLYVEQIEVAILGTGIYLILPFSHVQLGFFILSFLDLISCWIVVLANSMQDLIEDIPAAKRAWRAVGTVCDACREENRTSGDMVSKLSTYPKIQSKISQNKQE